MAEGGAGKSRSPADREPMGLWIVLHLQDRQRRAQDENAEKEERKRRKRERLQARRLLREKNKQRVNPGIISWRDKYGKGGQTRLETEAFDRGGRKEGPDTTRLLPAGEGSELRQQKPSRDAMSRPLPPLPESGEVASPPDSAENGEVSTSQIRSNQSKSSAFVGGSYSVKVVSLKVGGPAKNPQTNARGALAQRREHAPGRLR